MSETRLTPARQEQADPVKLHTRRLYLQSLLDRPRSTASPSSEEWESSERYQATQQILRDEVAELTALLKEVL